MKFMKKTALITAFVLLLSVFSSCGVKNAPDTTTVPGNTSASTTNEARTDAPTAVPDTSGNAVTEKNEPETATTPSADPVINTGTERSFYGAKDESADTFTRLSPLPLNKFENVRIENTRGLPTKTINHSFGAAKDGNPHQISINNQKFFDDGKYEAVCLDTKTDEKVLYLTFDCGYENGYTAKILDTLRDKNVKAAFFCTMPEMKENHDIIARMINEGHTVGNHSVTHPDFSSISREKMFEEVKGFDDYIREHFGYSSLYFRYPQGKYSESSLDLLNSMGYRCVFWSLAYADWDLNAQKGAAYAEKTVTERLHPGAVILLHAVSPDNAAALGAIIDDARSQGYVFRSLDEMDRES